MSTLTLKQGSTLRLPCVFTQNGAPIDLTGWQVQSWVRAPSGAVLHVFAVQITDAPAGQYLLLAQPAVTAKWPAPTVTFDVRYTAPGGDVYYTPSVSIGVEPALTTPEAAP